jgi:hypothetical protein
VRIVVNHLTRMSAPRICVAGVDPSTFAHIRPTTPPTDLITRRLLRDEGGPFGIGAVVDLGAVKPQPVPPESEDHRFHTRFARRVADLDGASFLALLDEASCSSLEDGFGPDLERIGWKYAVEAGMGIRSLAVIRARRRPVLEIDARYGRLQLRFGDSDPPTYLAVTDVRFYEPDHRTVRRDTVDDVVRRIRSGVDVYLMLGLARAYKAPADDRERHWLQLNGLCLADRPASDRP